MQEKRLSLSQRKEYVRNIRDLEVSCYQQQRFIGEVQSKMEKLMNYISAEPPYPSVGAEIVNFVMSTVLAALIGCGIGAALSVAAQFIGWGSGEVSSAAVKGAWIGGGIIGAICLLGILWEIPGKRRYKEEIHEANAQMGAFTEVLANSKEKLEETTGILNQYYDMDYIYTKYRGMVPICSICEYLEAGRCFSLEGPNGAYNLYEEEVRSNLIISKLDEVIKKLDCLNEGQHMLAQILRESNDRIDRLSCSLDSMGQSMVNIERNTALNTYFNKITSENSAYISWVAAWGSSFR